MTLQVTLLDADFWGCSITSVLFLKLLPNINLTFSHCSSIVCCCARQPQFYWVIAFVVYLLKLWMCNGSIRLPKKTLYYGRILERSCIHSCLALVFNSSLFVCCCDARRYNVMLFFNERMNSSCKSSIKLNAQSAQRQGSIQTHANTHTWHIHLLVAEFSNPNCEICKCPKVDDECHNFRYSL